MKADGAEATRLVRTARGQLDGVLRMIEENRYCMEVLNQLLAAQKILARAQREILTSHMESCVRAAFAEGEGSEKIGEIVELLGRM